MPFVVEVKYFNSFWLKQVVDDTTTDPFPDGKPIWPGGYPYNNTTDTQISAAVGPFPTSQIAAPGTSRPQDYYVEEARIRGGYNNTSVDFGAKAYLVEDNPNQQWRFNSMIYSGVFNSRTGVNYTNQFPSGTSITRSVDPINASIQKLYAEDTNLIIFQENKVSNALIDKDAIYTAEGQSITALGDKVIGPVTAYSGNFGISKNPESFAVYGNNKYFTDKDRNAVLMLSQAGISEISNVGMYDFFRDTYRVMIDNNTYQASYTGNKSEGVFEIQQDVTNSTTLLIQNLQGFIAPGAEIKGQGLAAGITVVSYDNATSTVVLSAPITYTANVALFCNTGGYTVVTSFEFEVSVIIDSYDKLIKGMSVLNVAVANALGNIVATIEEILPAPNGRVKIRTNRPVTIGFDSLITFTTPYDSYAVGGYDYWSKNYTLSLQPNPVWTDTKRAITPYSTLTFDQVSGGWTSFFSYKPIWLYSLKGNFYSLNSSSIYSHYTNSTRNKFYGIPYNSSITFVFNPQPTTQKTFKTVEYEGSNGWQVNSLTSDTTGEDLVYLDSGQTTLSSYVDNGLRILSYTEGAFTTGASYPSILTGQVQRAGFDRKENKYVASIKANGSYRPQSVLPTAATSGIKGHVIKAIFSQDRHSRGKEVELFSVGTEYTRTNGY